MFLAYVCVGVLRSGGLRVDGGRPAHSAIDTRLDAERARVHRRADDGARRTRPPLQKSA